MNNNLIFEFTVDKTTNTVNVNKRIRSRTFIGLGRIHETGNT